MRGGMPGSVMSGAGAVELTLREPGAGSGWRRRGAFDGSVELSDRVGTRGGMPGSVMSGVGRGGPYLVRAWRRFCFAAAEEGSHSTARWNSLMAPSWSPM